MVFLSEVVKLESSMPCIRILFASVDQKQIKPDDSVTKNEKDKLDETEEAPNVHMIVVTEQRSDRDKESETNSYDSEDGVEDMVKRVAKLLIVNDSLADSTLIENEVIPKKVDFDQEGDITRKVLHNSNSSIESLNNKSTQNIGETVDAPSNVSREPLKMYFRGANPDVAPEDEQQSDSDEVIHTGSNESEDDARYLHDIWIMIMKHLDIKSLLMLWKVNKWFHAILRDDTMWRFLAKQIFAIPARVDPQLSDNIRWINVYSSAIDGTHTYTPRPHDEHQCQTRHLYCKRVGSFYQDSSHVLVTPTLMDPECVEQMLEKGARILPNVRHGVWIVDLHSIDCQHGLANTAAEGTIQILDCRHVELFLQKYYQNGGWKYDVVGICEKKERYAGIFDLKHLKNPSNDEIFNWRSFEAMNFPCQKPRAITTLHAAAMDSQSDQGDDGLGVQYSVMRAGRAGEIVAIRMEQ